MRRTLSVRLSVCLSVRPSVPLSMLLQACARRAAYRDGHLGRTDSC